MVTREVCPLVPQRSIPPRARRASRWGLAGGTHRFGFLRREAANGVPADTWHATPEPLSVQYGLMTAFAAFYPEKQSFRYRAHSATREPSSTTGSCYRRPAVHFRPRQCLKPRRYPSRPLRSSASAKSSDCGRYA
jgi:hypothetical protein